MNKKIICLAFFTLFLTGTAFAASAGITIEFVENQLVATHVYDDDGSIERVDIFVANPGDVKQYDFRNVIEGQVFDVPFNDESTVSYNFTDTDGSIIGLGILIIVQRGTTPPICTGPDCYNPQITVIKSLKLNPRLAQGNSAYYIDVEVDVNADHSISAMTLFYALNSSNLSQTLGLVRQDNRYIGTLGPYNQEILLNTKATATDYKGKEYSVRASKWFEILLPSSNACAIGEVINAKAPIENLGLPQILRFAELEGFSYLDISKSDEGNLKAKTVYDDDDSIERVDTFYQQGTSITQKTYYNITQDMALGNIPSGVDFSWFNYFDFDGGVSNISVLNQFSEEGTIIIPPPPPEKPGYFTTIEFEAELAQNERNFEITVKVGKGADEPDSVKLFYYIDAGQQRSVTLAGTGSYWAGSLGSYDGQINLTGFVEASGEKGTQKGWFTPHWYALIQPEQLACEEICWDNIDNDNDGLVDEGCVLLPELFFQSKSIPYYSISKQPIKASVTVKNSGVATAQNILVEFSLDNEVLATQIIPELKANEARQIEFSVPYEERFEGIRIAKAEIDRGNKINEMIETNNIYEQELTVGPNFFNVEMNHNNTPFPSDYRQMKITDALERDVYDADVNVITPSGGLIQRKTNAKGIIEFQLPKSGTYPVSIAKEEYIPFEGKFGVSELRLAGLKEVLPQGQEQKFSVQNEENIRLESGTLEVVPPQGGTEKYLLNENPLVSFSASQQGRYALRVVRNNLVIYESDFLATGILESALFGPGSLLDLLFGPIIRNPLLLLLLIILAGLSAYFAHNKATMFFRKGAKGTTEKKVEKAIRLGIAFAYFIMPFQFDRLFGFNAALLSIFLEVTAILVYDYYLKRVKQEKKAIKV